MRGRGHTQRSLGAAVPIVSIAVTVVLVSWFMVGGGLRFQVLACWSAVAVFASLLSYFCRRAARQMEPTDARRRFWTALSVAAAIFAAGEFAQIVTTVVAPLSLPALTGTGLIRTAALAIGGIWLTAVVLTYPIPHRSARERHCYRLDLATVVIAGGSYGAYWAVATTNGHQGLLAHDLATIMAGPVVAMLTAFAVGRLYLSRVAPFNWYIGILGPFAAVVEALARALGPELVDAGQPGLIFSMTVGSHALLTICAWAQDRSAGRGHAPRVAKRARSFSLLPYVALGLTFALLVVTLVVRGFDLRLWVAVAGLAAITGVVVARQLISFVANEELLAERDALAATLHTMAFTDSLTGLANRAQFHERLDEALRSADRDVCVLLIDLDDFKPVNDTFGHAAGDAVLIEAAKRLRDSGGPTDVIARLGGDEFAVLLERPGPDGAAPVADRVVRTLGRPYRLTGGVEVQVGASVGAAVRDDDVRDASALLHRADEAMYSAKSAGKGSFRLASAS